MNADNILTRKVLCEKAPATFQLIRVCEFDGMGGREYIYHCGNCKSQLWLMNDWCQYCGCYLNGVNKKDTWGL